MIIHSKLLQYAQNEGYYLAPDRSVVFFEREGYLFNLGTGYQTCFLVMELSGLLPSEVEEFLEALKNLELPEKPEEVLVVENFVRIAFKEGLIRKDGEFYDRLLQAVLKLLDAIAYHKGVCVNCLMPCESKGLEQGLFCHHHVEPCQRKDIMMPNQNAPSREHLAELMKESAAYHQEMEEVLKDILSYPSVKAAPEEGAPYGKVNRELLDHFLDLGAAMGFKTGQVGHRVGWYEMGEGEQMVAVVCHLDVVPEGTGWTTPPFEMHERDGRYYARGTADDKGPLVASLFALKALKDEGYEPPCRLRLIVGTDEETGSSCLRYYAEHGEIPVTGFTADANFPVIYAEKGHVTFYFEQERSEPRVVLKASGGDALNVVPENLKATVSIEGEVKEVSYSGKGAHASLPWHGDNAVQKGMARLYDEVGAGCDPLLDLFHELLKNENKGESIGLAYEDETGPLTLNVACLDVDESRARIGFDIRYPVTMDRAKQIATLEHAAAQFGFKLVDVDDVEPLNLGKDSALVQTLMNVYNECCGTNAEAVAIGGGTYARALPNICAFGMLFPGDPDCFHQVDEFIEKDKFFASMTIYKRALKALAELQRE